MGNFSNYQREDSAVNNKLTGKRRCVIVGAEESVSKKSDLPMIIIAVKPSGCNFTVKTYIVNNENFNKNMTVFFDAFPDIQEGNFDFVSWIGAEGAANFKEDESGFLKVGRFLSPEQAVNLPPFEGTKPPKQTLTSLDDEEEEEDDDGELPFV